MRFDLLNNKRGGSVPSGYIHMERQSVCMGDDVNAPNAKELGYEEDTLLSDFLRVVLDSIPCYFDSQDTIWCIENEKKPIALLEIDAYGKITSELLREDIFVKDLEIKKIYCRYFYNYQGNLCSALSRYIDGKWEDLYPDCEALADKVKAFYESKEKDI